jgi:uncharacterized protein YgbK (DUF1537 family)
MITAVLDDDPTGTQAMADVPIVLDWADDAVATAVREDDPSVHLLTNSRAHPPAAAAAVTASAARAARAAFPDARLLLRGDSTLRGHVYEEYDAARTALGHPHGAVPLLLVPAFPAAGRVTVDGVHLLERDGGRVPLHDTEYATDGALAYADARLARWADDRSGGRLAAADAVEIPLAVVRTDGRRAVCEALLAASGKGRPAVVVPDAETGADLEVIAAGLRAAEAQVPVLARCAPAFAAVLTGTAARGPAAPPEAGRGVLVLCGSFVPTTTAQLAELDRAWPGRTVVADVRALAGAGSGDEVQRLAAAATALLDGDGPAIVATPRDRDPALVDADSQRRVASALARVARLVPADVVVAKGGITSAVTAREGLGARTARVVGPIATGVSRWQLPDGPAYCVVPGNVGGPGLLVEVVETILAARPGAAA